jgi:hypothetical protein
MMAESYQTISKNLRSFYSNLLNAVNNSEALKPALL